MNAEELENRGSRGVRGSRIRKVDGEDVVLGRSGFVAQCRRAPSSTPPTRACLYNFAQRVALGIGDSEWRALRLFDEMEPNVSLANEGELLAGCAVQREPRMPEADLLEIETRGIDGNSNYKCLNDSVYMIPLITN